MPTTHPPSGHRFRGVLVFSLVIAGSLSACVGKPPQREQAGATPESELAKLKLALREKETQVAALEKKHNWESDLARLKLALLEKEAQIAALEDKYNKAIQEVVRTKAKLHSLESKAEAASTMAEAEVALKALLAKAVELKDGPEVVQAGQLLQMSAQEFRNANYGGALYLASQAKGLVSIGQGRLTGRAERPIVSGEVLFALSIPLQASATGNVRQGPGLDSAVLFTVDKGTLLVGHSYKGEWVRVKDDEGRGGWIHQTLVGRRQDARQ